MSLAIRVPRSARVNRARWLSTISARPRYRPLVAVSGRWAYVSWNGATDVVRWELVAGPRKSQLRRVQIVAKKGFETRIPLRSAAGWIAVRALDRRGRALGRTATVSLD